jgi:LacI family transcriptional regulator
MQDTQPSQRHLRSANKAAWDGPLRYHVCSVNVNRTRNGHPTIKDVAARAAVSHMTVSRVMNGAAYVSETVRRRVEAAAQELGYAPNALARALVGQTTGVIGFLASDICNPHIAELARAVHRFADEESYVVNMLVSDYEPERELRALDVLLRRRVDGLIVGPPSSAADARIRELADQGIPVVAISRGINHPKVPEVIGEVRDSTYQATRHLIDLGHRAIGYIAGSPRVGLGHAKLEGYRAALRDAGVTPDESLVVGSDMSVRDAYLAAQLLLRRTPAPTAIMGVTDTIAIGAMGAIEASGRRIPEDVSVIGFDDIPFAATMHPPLATVAQPTYELGRTAARLLFEQIKRDDTPAEVQAPLRIVVECALVVRGSTGPCPRT